MKQFKLVSLSDRIDQIKIKYRNHKSPTDFMWNSCKKLELIYMYNDFLNQWQEPWMFVPMDDKGNVLEEPKSSLNQISKFQRPNKPYESFVLEFERAKERVLFEGFSVVTKSGF